MMVQLFFVILAAVPARSMSSASGGSGMNKAFVVVGGGSLTAALIYVSKPWSFSKAFQSGSVVPNAPSCFSVLLTGLQDSKLGQCATL